MSQMEQDFRLFLSSRPEVTKCYLQGLINRRALARHLMKEGVVKQGRLDAAIAMLRRYGFPATQGAPKSLFSAVRVTIKDKVLVLDYAKDRRLLEALKGLFSRIDFDAGETLKVVVGTSSIKLFIDSHNEGLAGEVLSGFRPRKRFSGVSEMSLLFPEAAISTKGVVSTITTELSLNDIVVTEILTATPELLVYLSSDDALTAYAIIKRLGA
ncbi:hypothetical protein JXB02_01255 [Candidatus Woesearchaeota archaeon]|nr:hypothetical protein [Candidatus Woesearchaeota archaeon]